jgi:hypothetical protein
VVFLRRTPGLAKPPLACRSEQRRIREASRFFGQLRKLISDADSQMKDTLQISIRHKGESGNRAGRLDVAKDSFKPGD